MPRLTRCQSATPPKQQWQQQQQQQQQQQPHTPISEATIDIAALPPPLPAPTARLPGCRVDAHLTRHAAITFEGAIVDELRDVEFTFTGPPGVTLTASPDDVSGIALRPQVALRLPAGPAVDEPAGASGALFDLGGLVAAGFVNLMFLPVSLPVGLLTNSELFLVDAPRFSGGMFSDVVLERAAWQREVERRAAPHAAELQREADRQARFAPFLEGLRRARAA